MTDKEIIEMANQAGFECTIHKQFTKANTFVEVGTSVQGDFASLNQFAKLVAEKEREECAKACEVVIFKVKPIYSVVAENCVKVIRARGQE
jgi:hypothetical protein